MVIILEIIISLDICDLALQYGITSNTKSGFEGRKEKLKKKVIAVNKEKAAANSLPDGFKAVDE